MTFDELTGEVQHRARLAGKGEALQATRATLTVLRSRLRGGAPDNLAGQLPMEVKEHLAGEGGGESFDLDEFHRRVAEVEGADLPEAVHHARAVLSVVDDATRGALAKERDQLDASFGQLFADVEALRRTDGG